MDDSKQLAIELRAEIQKYCDAVRKISPDEMLPQINRTRVQNWLNKADLLVEALIEKVA